MKERTYSNVSEALKGLAETGHGINFKVEGQLLKDVGSGKTFTKNQVKVIDTYRFEGESDPDDMSVLYVLETNDNGKGVLTDAFGLYATKEVGEFMDQITDVREEVTPTNVLPADPIS